jgi:site-specific DNA recombinase
MLALVMQSRREIARTREQGRYLGGRPSYGYRPADPGPQPNKIHASWGRRVHRLKPNL